MERFFITPEELAEILMSGLSTAEILNASARDMNFPKAHNVLGYPGFRTTEVRAFVEERVDIYRAHLRRVDNATGKLQRKH